MQTHAYLTDLSDAEWAVLEPHRCDYIHRIACVKNEDHARRERRPGLIGKLRASESHMERASIRVDNHVHASRRSQLMMAGDVVGVIVGLDDVDDAQTLASREREDLVYDVNA